MKSSHALQTCKYIHTYVYYGINVCMCLYCSLVLFLCSFLHTHKQIKFKNKIVGAYDFMRKQHNTITNKKQQ